MSLLGSPFVLIAQVLAESDQDFDENLVTPGVVGFGVTFLVIAVVVLLIFDMVRRVRRTQYRSEINELLDAEEAAKTGDDSVPE